jgi:hypothetical protein
VDKFVAVLQPPARWEVWDPQSKTSVVFDSRGTEKWGPIEEYEDWNTAENFWAFKVEMTLYRHAKGHWTLISESWFQLDAAPPPVPEATRLTDAEAASWLVRHGFDAPKDVAHLAAGSLFVPGPPAPPQPKVIARDTPAWNKDRAELTFRGAVVKRIKSATVAKNVVRVLDAFQEDGWPDRIDDPLDPSENTQRLYETLKRLNDNLECLRFRADGTTQGILWEPTAPEPPRDTEELPF